MARARIALSSAALLCAACSGTDTFPGLFIDPNLEAVIRVVISKPSGLLSPIDLLIITDLDASAAGITDLSGLELLPAKGVNPTVNNCCNKGCCGICV